MRQDHFKEAHLNKKQKASSILENFDLILTSDLEIFSLK